METNYCYRLLSKEAWLEFSDRVGVDDLSSKLARNPGNLRLGEVSVGHDDIVVFSSDCLGVGMNLDCEMLLGGIEPHLEYSVVEMDIWP